MTACALDPSAFLGKLPILGSLFPDQFLGDGGAALASIIFKAHQSYSGDEESDGRASQSAITKLNNGIERLKNMDLSAMNSFLYTTSNCQSVVVPVAPFSISSVFFVQWLNPVFVWKFLLNQEKYASRIMVICYEEFIEDPGRVWSDIILPFCHLQMKEVNGKRLFIPPAMHNDSQLHSLFSREKLKPHFGQLLPCDIQLLDKVIDAAGVASSLANFCGLQ